MKKTPESELEQINSREKRYELGQFFTPEPPRPSRDPAVAFHLILRVGRDEKDAVVVAGPAETPTELISRTQAKVKMLLDEARPSDARTARRARG